MNFLDQMVTSAHAEISEVDFRHYFLPMFTGQLKPEEEEKMRQRWINYVAGNPFISVDVINTYAEVVVTIPPTHDPNPANVSAQNKSITEIMNLFRHGMKHIPMLADKQLDRDLETIEIETDISEFTLAWQKVYEYFQVPVEVEAEEPETQSSYQDIDLQDLIG